MGPFNSVSLEGELAGIPSAYYNYVIGIQPVNSYTEAYNESWSPRSGRYNLTASFIYV